MAAIAIALRCESAGPVFVRQRRFGFNDNPIDVWKFRTTRAGAPARAGSSRQAGKAEDDASPLGRLLEKCGFDELPQLVNVLLGDMSIVGPRPRRAAQADKGLPFQGIIERYAAWHQIKPGITGLAQIKGHYEHANGAAKLKKEIEHDLHYIENWSVFLDFWIILRTAVLVFKDRTVL